MSYIVVEFFPQSKYMHRMSIKPSYFLVNTRKKKYFAPLFQDWGPAFVPQGIWYVFATSLQLFFFNRSSILTDNEVMSSLME